MATTSFEKLSTSYDRAYPLWPGPNVRGWGRALPDARAAAGSLSGRWLRRHAPRDVPRRDTPRDVTRRRLRRDHALRRDAGDAEHPLRPLCQLRLHYRRLAEEGGETLVPSCFGVQGIDVAGVGPLQGVVEDADQVVVFVAGARCLLARVHKRSSSVPLASTALQRQPLGTRTRIPTNSGAGGDSGGSPLSRRR